MMDNVIDDDDDDDDDEKDIERWNITNIHLKSPLLRSSLLYGNLFFFVTRSKIKNICTVIAKN